MSKIQESFDRICNPTKKMFGKDKDGKEVNVYEFLKSDFDAIQKLVNIEKNNKRIFLLSFMSLLLALLMFGVMLTDNILKERSLRLYEHVLEDCKIDNEEYKALNEDNF